MAKKSATVKSINRKENMRAFVEFIKTSGYAYEIEVSNYTTKIKSELYEMQFLQSMRSKQCFAAFAKVKADVARHGNPPNADSSDVRYFEHDFRGNYFSEEVINIDLKSAYATALYNAKVLSDGTFAYLSRISKMDRLASVGMLASKKHCFRYSASGAIIDYEKRISPFQNYFYFAVKEVQRVMDELRAISENDYLFTWVDGIYLKPDAANIYDCFAYLEKEKFNYHIEKLKNFSVKVTDKKVFIQFEKEGKTKYFNIPSRLNMFANDIINFLSLKKQ